MTTVKVTAVGTEVGIVLPKELLESLRVSEGDTLYVVETASGLQLVPRDPELGRQVEIAEEVMRKNRNVLRKLAE